MPIRKMGYASLDNVPLFEQPMAQKLGLARGSNPNDIAHTETSPLFGRNSVFVDRPEALTQPVLNHEVMHKIQQRAGNVKSVGEDPDYNYGDPAEIKSIGNLDSEKQAQIVQDYTGRLAHLASRPINNEALKEADTLNSSYARPIRQLGQMAQDEINTTPQAPGPPPAALTGMIKPLPEIGGPTLYSQGIQKLGQR